MFQVEHSGNVYKMMHKTSKNEKMESPHMWLCVNIQAALGPADWVHTCEATKGETKGGNWLFGVKHDKTDTPSLPNYIFPSVLFPVSSEKPAWGIIRIQWRGPWEGEDEPAFLIKAAVYKAQGWPSLAGMLLLFWRRTHTHTHTQREKWLHFQSGGTNLPSFFLAF